MFHFTCTCTLNLSKQNLSSFKVQLDRFMFHNILLVDNRFKMKLFAGFLNFWFKSFANINKHYVFYIHFSTLIFIHENNFQDHAYTYTSIHSYSMHLHFKHYSYNTLTPFNNINQYTFTYTYLHTFLIYTLTLLYILYWALVLASNREFEVALLRGVARSKKSLKRKPTNSLWPLALNESKMSTSSQ